MSKRRDNTIVSLIRLLQNHDCMSHVANDSFFDIVSRKRYINWLKLYHVEFLEQITVIIIMLKRLVKPKV